MCGSLLFSFNTHLLKGSWLEKWLSHYEHVLLFQTRGCGFRSQHPLTVSCNSSYRASYTAASQDHLKTPTHIIKNKISSSELERQPWNQKGKSWLMWNFLFWVCVGGFQCMPEITDRRGGGGEKEGGKEGGGKEGGDRGGRESTSAHVFHYTDIE